MSMIDLHIDACGLSCPLPLLKLKQALHGLPSGATVQLLASDAASRMDIVSFCQVAGHAVQFNQPAPQQFEFTVVKDGSKPLHN